MPEYDRAEAREQTIKAMRYYRRVLGTNGSNVIAVYEGEPDDEIVMVVARGKANVEKIKEAANSLKNVTVEQVIP